MLWARLRVVRRRLTARGLAAKGFDPPREQLGGRLCHVTVRTASAEPPQADIERHQIHGQPCGSQIRHKNENLASGPRVSRRRPHGVSSSANVQAIRSLRALTSSWSYPQPDNDGLRTPGGGPRRPTVPPAPPIGLRLVTGMNSPPQGYNPGRIFENRTLRMSFAVSNASTSASLVGVLGGRNECPGPAIETGTVVRSPFTYSSSPPVVANVCSEPDGGSTRRPIGSATWSMRGSCTASATG
jgi:hypothetical protein